MVDVQTDRTDQAPPGFDAETFQAFVGENVNPDILQKIRDAANGNLERAINMYLDGSWKNVNVPASRLAQYGPLPSRGLGQFSTQDISGRKIPLADLAAEAGEGERREMVLRSTPKERYVGSF